MGGLITTLNDFVKYTAFHLSTWAPRSDAIHGPISRSSIRSMQTARVIDKIIGTHKLPLECAATLLSPYFDTDHHAVGVVSPDVDRELAVDQVVSYGYGLKCIYDSRRNCRFVGHSGGLPGFGRCILSLHCTISTSIYSIRNRRSRPIF